MKIGEVAEKTGCSIQTIRFYERKGLLNTPNRTAANYRYYDSGTLKQLTFIKQCRSLDMSIEEIKTLLKNKEQPDASCDKVNTMIQTHISQVSERIVELKALKGELQSMAAKCDHERQISDCGILQSLQTEP